MSQADFSLVVCLPDGEPVSHKIEGDAATIGRSPENNIQILVAEVSVRHGSIVRDGEGFRIVDPGSTNGTKLNDTRVGPNGAALNPMDRLVFGTVVKAYFVPTAVLATTSPVELAASIEASADAAKGNKTAPVAVAVAALASPGGSSAPGAPVRAGIPVKPSAPAAPVTPGGATVRLDQVTGPTAPPVATPVKPGAGAPPAALPPRAAPGAPPAAVPVRPAPGVPPGVPAQQPLRPPGAAPVAPGGVKPGAPAPQPLRPPGVAPSAPTIPLPKSPPKPGQ